MDTRASRHRALLALLLLVPAPSLGVYMMTFGGGGSFGQVLWGLGKVWLLGFPLMWYLLVEKGRLTFPKPRCEGMLLGVISGLLIGGAMLGAFFLFGRDWIDAEWVRQRIEIAGFGTKTKILMLAVYTCLVNALLEEYVWRWFVYRQCEGVAGKGIAAVLLAAVLFTIHHVIALAFYFDWRIVTLATSGVFAGGVIWSWFYLRYRHIWPGYVSHVLADVAIFIMTWIIVFA